MDVNSTYYAVLVLQKLEPTVFAKHALAHMMDAMCFDDADPFLSRNAAVIVVERFDLAVNKQEHHVGAVETMLNVLREWVKPLVDCASGLCQLQLAAKDDPDAKTKIDTAQDEIKILARMGSHGAVQWRLFLPLIEHAVGQIRNISLRVVSRQVRLL